MEQFPTPRKESGINRVVGFDNEPQAEQMATSFFRRRFEHNQIIPGYEIEQTAEQAELINRMNVQVRDFLKRYGIDSIDITAQNIHIIDKPKFTPEEIRQLKDGPGDVVGYHDPERQCIVVMQDYNEDKAKFFRILVHEMFHMQSFVSYQKTTRERAEIGLAKGDVEAQLTMRRSGFSIRKADSDIILFNKLNEAIITELEILFVREYLSTWPELADGRRVETLTYSYSKECAQLRELISELFEKNKDTFNSSDEVFRMFVDATMTGRLLPIARLIDTTFGAGAFRKLGQDTQRELGKK